MIQAIILMYKLLEDIVDVENYTFVLRCECHGKVVFAVQYRARTRHLAGSARMTQYQLES